MNEFLAVLLWLASAAAIESVPSDFPAEQAPESLPSLTSTVTREAVAIEIYNGPKAISTTSPRYPRDAQRNSEEGWVQVNFMVDTQGEPYEISASDFAGDVGFVDAAIAAVKRWRFEPANLDGVPLDAGANVKIRFSLEGGVNGASRSFVRAYKEFASAVGREDREQADVLFAKLQVKNLYEDAYYNIGRYMYAEKWGSATSRRRALRRAIAYEDDARYLPEATFTSALRTLVALQLAEELHAEALDSTER